MRRSTEHRTGIPGVNKENSRGKQRKTAENLSWWRKRNPGIQDAGVPSNMNTNEFSGTKPRAVSAASVVSVVLFVREVLQPQL